MIGKKIVRPWGTKNSTLYSLNTSIDKNVENGLELLLSHFNQEKRFPRTIQTYKSEGKQIEVLSKSEALRYFKESNYIDCKINAFPSYTEYKGIQRYPPDIIFIDIDDKIFTDEKQFEKALSKTCKNIKENTIEGVVVEPTVNHSGNGYHIILPIECPILEQIPEFEKYKDIFPYLNISQEFIRFAEIALSNGKADKSHYPSFKSCHIRVPGTINKKCLDNRAKRMLGVKVKTIRKWNGVRAHITKEFIEDFRTYLEQKVTDQELELQQDNKLRFHNSNSTITSNNSIIYWIEKLLQIPVYDFRKLILWRILCPYLVNIKKISYEESYNIIINWLNKCNDIEKLDFNANKITGYELKHVRRYSPLGLKRIKNDLEFKQLYQILRQKGVLNN